MAQQSLDNSLADGQPTAGEFVPQDEKFWRRYSPHHEFPLSSAASAALHVLAIAVLILGGILAAKWGLGSADNAIPISIMEDPGGGGQPEGTEGGTGGPSAAPKEAVPEPSKPETVAQLPSTPKETLTDPKVDPVELPKIQDTGTRFIDESNEAIQGLRKLDEAARKNLFNSLREPAKGKGGTGTGGGKGAGTGTGTGSGTGAGEGNLNTRQKRVLRWEVNFRVASPEDHLRQFAALGAILAVPDPQGRYHVFRNLSAPPYVGRVEDLSNINRIWFIDRNPETVAGISSLLRMPPPPVLIAFFPQKLEEQMAEMERRYRGQKEEDIHEKFLFQVVPRSGTYQVVVGER